MDHKMQLEEHHDLKQSTDEAADLKQCTDEAADRIRRIVTRVSQIALALAIAAVAFLSLCSSSATRASPASSAPPARLLALCSFAMTKKALFVLSNAIFLFLAADYRCCFLIRTLPQSSGDVGACEQQRAAQPCVSSSSNLCHSSSSSIASENTTNPAAAARNGEEIRINASISDTDTDRNEPQEGEEEKQEASSVAMDTVIIEEPTCGAAQELETLEMDELNKKFEEFIQSRRVKWIEEEAAYMKREQDDEALRRRPACLTCRTSEHSM